MRIHFRHIEPDPGISSTDWNSWIWQQRNSLVSRDDFARRFSLSDDEAAALAQPGFQVRCSPYYAALASREEVDDPIRRMILPSGSEAQAVGQQLFDPLGERKHSPVPRLVHRYPDRVLFLVTDQCSL